MLTASLKRISDLEDHLDLMKDEFQRIKALTDDPEILGLCDRAAQSTTQKVSVIRQRDSAEAELTKLKADVERLRGKCEWTESEDYPCQTSCGHEFEFIYDSISENNFKFCPFCGGEIAARALDETK